MNRMNIKKGDLVQVIAGKDKGKRGVIEQVLPAKNRVVVTGINIVKRHIKPSQKQPRGGIIEKPASMDRSNVMVVSPETDKPTRIKHKVADNGTKFRTSSTGVNLDSK